MSRELSRLNNRFKPFYTNYLSLKNDPVFFAYNDHKSSKQTDQLSLKEVALYMESKLDEYLKQNEPTEYKVISRRLEMQVRSQKY